MWPHLTAHGGDRRVPSGSGSVPWIRETVFASTALNISHVLPLMVSKPAIWARFSELIVLIVMGWAGRSGVADSASGFVFADGHLETGAGGRNLRAVAARYPEFDLVPPWPLGFGSRFSYLFSGLSDLARRTTAA